MPGPRSPTATLTLAQARRVALAAQGFADRRPTGMPGVVALRRVLGRVAVLQIDSVNTVVRSHYLPLFSRLGAYPTSVLERAAYRAPRRLFEYWGHEASLLPVELHPLLRWRMEVAGDGAWGRIRRFAAEKPRFVADVLAAIEAHGPMTVGEAEAVLQAERPGGRGPWWDWNDTKIALEWLFWSGRVSTAARRAFARVYDLTERVVPTEVLAVPTPAPSDAWRGLVETAARSLGVATEPDLRDYFRLSAAQAKLAVAELVSGGVLTPVAVEGWSAPAYLHHAARVPRRVAASALLSPFDSLVWFRPRTERLFGFRYRLEFYTPAHRRVYGYYVLPYLLGERLCARVDLKADRAAGVLRVPAWYPEPGVAAAHVAEPLAADLVRLATWLRLSDVVVSGGDRDAGVLARAIRRAG